MSAANTEAQRNAFLIVPKFSAVLSIIGSSIILWDVYQHHTNRRRRTTTTTTSAGNNHNNKTNNNNGTSTTTTTIVVTTNTNRSTTNNKLTPRHRILAGMSICDLLASCAWFVTSWAIPSDYQWAKWNIGNQTTCTAQGFFVQWSIGTSTYNCCLAIYFFLVIRQKWSDERISKYVEPIMHLIAITFTLGTSIAGIVLDLYNPLGWECWIAESPRGCTQTYKSSNSNPPNCIRGDNANLYHYMFLYIPTWIAFFILTSSMILIYLRIRTLELQSSNHFSSNSMKQQRRFAKQAGLYVSAYFISWSIATSANLLYITTDKVYFWHVFFSVVTIPLQGFFNCIVYKLPQYQQVWRQQKRQRRRHRRTSSTTTTNNVQPTRNSDSDRHRGGGSSGGPGGGGDDDDHSATDSQRRPRVVLAKNELDKNGSGGGAGDGSQSRILTDPGGGDDDNDNSQTSSEQQAPPPSPSLHSKRVTFGISDALGVVVKPVEEEEIVSSPSSVEHEMTISSEDSGSIQSC